LVPKHAPSLLECMSREPKSKPTRRVGRLLCGCWVKAPSWVHRSSYAREVVPKVRGNARGSTARVKPERQQS